MATEIDIQVIQSVTVKPSSPTPDNHRFYKLSLLDQVCPTHRTPVILFYRRATDLRNIWDTSQLLMTSLSQTLTRFYTFAGRLRDNIAIECNDQGAEFFVARVNCPLLKVLENPDMATLTQLIPSRAIPKEAAFTSPLLLVKASFFDCGGIAIGVCLSHKAGDASTLSTFLNSWAAATAKSEIEPVLVPEFVSSTSIFPPLDSLASFVEIYEEADGSEKIKVKRLVFDGSRIDALKSEMAASSTVPNPTRVEAVSALIWKCAIEALTLSNSLENSDKLSSCFIQTMNVRKRMEPSLPENSMGNLLWFFQAMIMSSSKAKKTELKDLVVLLRKGIEEMKALCKMGIPPEALSGCVAEMARAKSDVSIHRFSASSWCGFPLYGADFGWGKPVWVCIPILRVKNTILLMDTRDGQGIETVLWLGEEEMKCFEKNQQLLAFASSDPNVIIN